eukprot:m.73400 g.73400  ORF g.73400 m.73400 type:complete len:782 (-) comp14346_c0_seq1:22-2367(-)
MFARLLRPGGRAASQAIHVPTATSTSTSAGAPHRLGLAAATTTTTRHLHRGPHRALALIRAGVVSLSHGGKRGWQLPCASHAQHMRSLSTDPPKNEDDTTADASTSAEATPEQEPQQPLGDQVDGTEEKHTFQAETKRLLDIVAGSLYSEKEVFVRELVSNASDALEKLRHAQLSGDPIADADAELQISINLDEANKTLTIADSGIGMTKDEMIDCLGTIAKSGSKEFLAKMAESKSPSAASNIIGQFGVGFYSAFMVGSELTVFSKSANPDAPAHVWKSTGDGSYEIAEAKNVTRGTKIVIKLKDDAEEFATKQRLSSIVHKYSDFVSFPILLNGEKVNTLDAIWLKQPSEISEEQHNEFYQYIATAWDKPLFRLHYSADAPLSLRALFYIPSTSMEKMGLGRMEPGVSLYCRKVLIQKSSDKLLPAWLRFVRGVVDSEDIPLNLSREMLQDSALIAKLNSLLARRIIRLLKEKAKKEPEEYLKFYLEYNAFIKEGIVTDNVNQSELSRLVMFQSSKEESGKLISLGDYKARMPESQKEIFYLSAPSRAAAEASPYLDALKKQDFEVLFLLEPLDEVVVSYIPQFDETRLVSIESSEVNVGDAGNAADRLDSDAETVLLAWLKAELGENRIRDVKASSRLVDAPAIIVDHESASSRRMRKMVNPDAVFDIGAQSLEVNTAHPLVKTLYNKHFSNKEIARSCAEQIYDNACVTAGLMEDARTMVPRINSLMMDLLDKYGEDAGATSTTASPNTARARVVADAEIVDDIPDMGINDKKPDQA